MQALGYRVILKMQKCGLAKTALLPPSQAARKSHAIDEVKCNAEYAFEKCPFKAISRN